ncbi:ParB family protein [Salinisphaera orenii]|uniref:ParB family protein n=1 Tax=Salinisphaera orenii TaxID=856731 RepID=UPI0013A66114
MVSRKRPGPDEMDALLNEPNFSRDTDEAASTQAVTPTPMLIDIDNLAPYDYNPRQVTNEAYDQIKTSIAANGLDQVLVVTQRPNPEDPSIYMIAAGGNTRLTALKQLYAETGDDQFKQVWCQFRPWQDEADTLLAHIRENELRTDLVLIDRALALRNLRNLMEAETDTNTGLSQRAFRDELSQRGYTISQTLIRWYDYAVDTLYDRIPTVLRAGLGRPRIEEIYNLERAFRGAAETLSPDQPLPVDTLFTGVLGRHDADYIDTHDLRRDLESEMVASTDLDIDRVSMVLGAHLDGSIHRVAEIDPNIDLSTQTRHGQALNQPTTDDQAPSDPAGDGTPTIDHATTQSPTDEAHGLSDTTAPVDSCLDEADQNGSTTIHEPGSDADTDAGPEQALSGPTTDAPTDLESLRSRAWTLATKLAQGSRMGSDIVLPITTGIGFLISPVPTEIVEPMSPEIARTVILAWWHLATISEQFADHGHALAAMPAAWQDQQISRAMHYAHEGEMPLPRWQWTTLERALHEQVPGFEPNAIGPWLYCVWTDQQWQAWTALVETYRTIHKATGDAPWGE